MKKYIYAVLALVTACGVASAQKVTIIGQEGTAIAVYKLEDIKEMQFGPSNDSEARVAVDLGLSVKWANMNLGADKSTEYGRYYAWGETQPKSCYSTENSLTHYKTVEELREMGVIDGSGNLTASHDAAAVNWGDGWRMPTKEEMAELAEKCTWTKTERDGVVGLECKGPSGQIIFFPKAGDMWEEELSNTGELGLYWSSTPYTEKNRNDLSWHLTTGIWDEPFMIDAWRYTGRSVRAVRK